MIWVYLICVVTPLCLGTAYAIFQFIKFETILFNLRRQDRKEIRSLLKQYKDEPIKADQLRILKQLKRIWNKDD